MNGKVVCAELAYKEERLKALRSMNSKLESKCFQILKKFEAFQFYEAKAFEAADNSNRMAGVIEELQSALHKSKAEMESLNQNNEILNNEKYKLEVEIESLKILIGQIRNHNEELTNKNFELENKFKKTLETRDIASISQTRDKGKTFHSTALNNLTKLQNEVNFIFIQKNNDLAVDELKPAKIVVSNNNLEIR